ncbi:MAG: dynamin family protein [Chromatiales bacterium]|nr:dynamin family protein [Chromatiales bacterium]
MFDLKQLRERAGLTQAQLAQRLNTNQVQISRYEVAPGNVPISMIQAYLAALGLDLATELNRAAQTPAAVPVAIHQPYSSIKERLSETLAFISSLAGRTTLLGDLHPSPQELARALQQAARKPRLLITGSFDAGKSHLANYLLGKHCLPTGYQPETRIPIYVRHIDDRPAFIQEEVWIMDEGFSPDLWDHPEHAQAHKKLGGNFVTLNDWASHSGRHNDIPLGTALAFVDAPLLEGCDLIDVPGNLHTQEELQTAQAQLPISDIILYASSSKGFLNGADMVQLHYIHQQLRLKNPMADQNNTHQLAIVATHADPSIKSRTLADILQRGAERLTTAWSGDHALSQTQVNEQLFSFWEETPERNQALQHWLQQTLGNHFPQQAAQNFDNLLSGFINEAQQHCQTQIALLQAMQKSEGELASTDSGDVDSKRERIVTQIIERREQSAQWVGKLIKEQLTLGKVQQLIKELYPERDQARQYATPHITNQLLNAASVELQAQFNALLPLIQAYIDDISQPHLNLGDSNPLQQAGSIPLNRPGAFRSTPAAYCWAAPQGWPASVPLLPGLLNWDPGAAIWFSPKGPALSVWAPPEHRP